jgi:hydroxypyruvate isomerase
MNYKAVINAAREQGYAGPIGLECIPKDKDDRRAVLDILELADSLKG